MKIGIKNWLTVVNVSFPFVLTEAKLKGIRLILSQKDYEFIEDKTPHGQLLGKRPRILRFEYQSRFISEKKFERLMIKMAKTIKENVRY